MQKIKQIKGVAAVLNIANIDTDQIIPAEHLKITNKEGLGQYLFSNWRYTPSGEEASDFILNKTETRSSSLLITGDNFGCGSSREHAPWALVDFGIRVIVSTSIADIFKNNAVKSGLLPICVTSAEHALLLTQNAQELTVSIETQTISMGDKTIHFELEPFTRYCFLNGMEQLDFLLSNQNKIDTFEQQQVRYLPNEC